MKKIKFSHWYAKFDSVLDDYEGAENTATLIQALKIHYNDLSPEMIDCDTLYYDPNSKRKKYYQLPKTDLILLLFMADYSGGLFTTIRRYTQKKYEYYRNSVGEKFLVEILGR